MPLPPVQTTLDSVAFWEFAAQGKLMIRVCTACGHKMYYPRVFCTKCLSDALEWQAARGVGTVYSFSVIHKAANAEFRDRVPYVIALIDLEEGVRMMSNVTHCDVSTVHIGMPVQVWFDDAIPKFRPVASSA